MALPSILVTTEFLDFGALIRETECLARLCLRFYSVRVPSNHLFCEMHLTSSDDFSLKHVWGVYAYDVARFVAELDALHVSLGGVAELRGTFDAAPRVIVAAHSSERGRLCVSGETLLGPGPPQVGTAHGEATLGVRVDFSGFSLDQSYIPNWILRSASPRLHFCWIS